MKKVENFNLKNEISEDLKIIEIGGRRILDVNNEEGALIKPDKILFVDTKILGNKEPIVTELNDIDGVTSHAYMGCAEIIGKLSSGDRFYFHSRHPHSFEQFIKKIFDLVEDKDVTIDDIKIRGEFGRNASSGKDKKEYSDSEIRRYKEICDDLKINNDSIDIKEEVIAGYTGEKAVGYSWTENRD